ncbi:MAG: ribosome biogenesis GTP-binding protein YihA/YsxC [Desulfovermiculus sp.]|nr:ribosome biogenesis GTP-binding protein YihA/YsxC [Desulfovermiculus sp.]
MTLHLELAHTIYTLDQIQDWPGPQVVISGRSNVGKSSLINTLAGRKSLAKTSSSPGKTRSINLYWMPTFQGYLVDLPGYGYAKRSKKERELWAKLVNRYFESNLDQITRVLILIDSRLPPQQLDLELVSSLKGQQIAILPVLTKVDKTKMGWRSKIQRTWKDLTAAQGQPLLFSAKTGQGSKELVLRLQELMTEDRL